MAAVEIAPVAETTSLAMAGFSIRRRNRNLGCLAGDSSIDEVATCFAAMISLLGFGCSSSFATSAGSHEVPCSVLVTSSLARFFIACARVSKMSTTRAAAESSRTALGFSFFGADCCRWSSDGAVIAAAAPRGT